MHRKYPVAVQQQSAPHRQRGAALLVFTLLAVIAILSAFIGGLANHASSFVRDEPTDAALQQATTALIGYAARYRETHPNQPFGYLPCPDENNDGEAEGNCGAAGTSRIGRLPWKTLDLPPLRASDGECLWYIVSGTHKNSPKTDPLNWDTWGRIRMVDLAGSVLIDNDDSVAGNTGGGVVAAIIAPGRPLPVAGGQNRPSGNQVCGGDGSNSHAAYLDGGYATENAGTLTVVAGRPDSDVNNDRVATISARELFDPIAKRGDLFGPPPPTPQMIAQLRSCLDFTSSNSLPASFTAHPSIRVASSAGIDEVRVARGGACDLPANTLFRNIWDQWKDHFRYVVCEDPLAPCLSLAGVANQCSAALLFGGRTTSGAPRTAAQKAGVAAYFEGPNLDTLQGAALNISGPSAYSAGAPNQDVVVCLTPSAPAPPPTQITGVSGFTSGTTGPSIAANFATSEELGSLSSPPGQDTSACRWFDQPIDFRNGLRVYFEMEVVKDESGIVFAIADATKNPGTVNLCGAGADNLGYAGAHPLSAQPILPPKIGLELDMRPSGSWDSLLSTVPFPPPANEHAAFVYWGTKATSSDDVTHGQGTGTASEPRNPTNDVATGDPGDADDGLRLMAFQESTLVPYYRIRLDIRRNPANGDYRLRAYIVPSASSALACTIHLGDLSDWVDNLDGGACAGVNQIGDHVTIDDTLMTGAEKALDRVHLGFTIGQRDGQGQRIIINNFTATNVP